MRLKQPSLSNTRSTNEGLETMGYLKEFISAYVECALWSSHDTDDHGNAYDGLEGLDLSPEAEKVMRQDCIDFVWANRHALRKSGLDAGQAGHDFWLTRNGHGAGFWDRGLGEIGDYLSRQSKPYGSCDLYVGDDELVYVG
jgi:hypothetical protein